MTKREFNHQIAQYKYQTASGNGSVSFNGDVSCVLPSAEFEGKCEQQTYSGKNLFNFDAITGTQSQSAGRVDTANKKLIAEFGLYGYRIIWNGWQLTTTQAAKYTVSADVFIPAENTVTRIALGFYSINQGTYYYNVANGTLGSKVRLSMQISLPSNCTAIIILQGVGNASEYQYLGVEFSNIQVEIGSGASSYEPYVGGVPSPSPQYPQAVKSNNSVWTSGTQTVDLSAIELRGIGSAKDEWDAQTGDGIRRIGIVDLGSLNWNSIGDGRFYVTRINPNYKVPSSALIKANILAQNYQIIAANVLGDGTAACIHSNGLLYVMTGDASITPIGILYYELAEPVLFHVNPQHLQQSSGANTIRQISGDIANTALSVQYVAHA